MANKPTPPPAVHAYASDPGYGDFSTESLNPTANNLAEANLIFDAPRLPEIQNIDDYSLADLRVLSKELELVKQR